MTKKQLSRQLIFKLKEIAISELITVLESDLLSEHEQFKLYCIFREFHKSLNNFFDEN